MPKVSGSGNATAYGQEGHIVGADGVLSELDPSRNVDGSVVDGYESDERDLSEEPGGQEEPEEGEQPSRGSSSETSSGRTGKTATRK